MKLHEIPKDINWKRRALTTTSWFFLAIVLTALLPVIIPLTALYDVMTRNQLSASRTTLFFTFFFVIESTGLVVAFWLKLRRIFGMRDRDYEIANRKLQRWWSRGLFWGSVRIFAVDCHINGLEELEDERPCIVLSRHASTLDTMLPIAVVREMKHFRYVIKSELLASPALDYVAQRFPNVFVNRGGDNPEFEIEKVVALGTELEPKDAVVVYPEGTRFSRRKRLRLIEKFEDNPDMLDIATELRNTLPPLREGGVRLIEETPEADVVFIAHRGIEGAGAMSDLFSGGLTKANLDVAIWRFSADEVPRDDGEVRQFLVENWKRIDHFVSQKTLPGEQRKRLAE